MALVESEQLPLGWEAKDFNLPGTDEMNYSLSDFAGKKGILIVFTCNHCPYAKAAWPLLVELYRKYGTEIPFIAINPNDAEVYPEDSFEVMKQKKVEWKIPFPYLYDQEQTIAKLYKAQCTPDPYLFKVEDSKPRLFYHGRINDNWQEPEKVNEKNLEEALQGLLNNQEAPDKQPPSMGCSIKWKK